MSDPLPIPPTPDGPAYRYAAVAEQVHDGDTYTLRLDLGFNVSTTIKCRLRSVNAPELPTKEGLAARTYAAGILTPLHGADPPTPLIIESYKGRQSFARWVCDVWFLNGKSQWESLAQNMLDAGQAVPLIIP